MSKRLPSVIPAAALMLVSIVGVLALRGPPAQDGPAALVFPPWWSPGQIVSAAASVGEVRAAGTVPYVVIIQSAAPDVARRARFAGALLTLEGSALGFCGPAAKV